VLQFPTPCFQLRVVFANDLSLTEKRKYHR
jgi:hypothetical protein